MRTVPFGLLAMMGQLACADPRAATGKAGPAESVADACAGVPDAEREASPLEAPHAIEMISPVHRYLWTGRGTHRAPVAGTGKLIGVIVTLNTPGRTTREELQARLWCHMAWMRARLSPGDSPALRSCPLAVPGASAEVRMGYGQRFIVAIGGRDERAAKEIWRRANALVETGKGASEDQETLK